LKDISNVRKTVGKPLTIDPSIEEIAVLKSFATAGLFS